MQQQKEEQQLESALDSIILKVNDLKSSIAALLYKLENDYENLNWPVFLDNYALLSGHLTSLSKTLSNDKCPILRNLTVLPLITSPEIDEQLAEMTEHRVSTFAHDLIPDYLRTKLEPMAESKITELEQKAGSLSDENAQKQINAYEKIISHILDIVNKTREEWEVESSREDVEQHSNMADTQLLVAAVGMGKGLKMVKANSEDQGGTMVDASSDRSGSGLDQNPTSTTTTNKAPSTIKTNIKSAPQRHLYR